MRIDTGQHLRLDQRMKLVPRMIQSMEILQMPSLALEERIDQELASNPTLELRETAADPEQTESQRTQEERDAREGERELVVRDESEDPNHADDFERLSNIAEAYGEAWESNTYETGSSQRVHRDSGNGDDKMDAMANAAARAQSITDQLLTQWSLVDTPARIEQAGCYLIGFIDDDGYIRTDRAELVNQAPPGMTQEDLDAALTLIQQSLEPMGIGARDLRECLLLQIDDKVRTLLQANPSADDGTLAAERLLVSDHLKDIEANRLPRVAKSTDMSIEQVKSTLAKLRQFHPHPGRLLVEDRPRLIRPDAVIEYDEQEDRYTARLTHERIPRLRINTQYLKMIRDTALDRSTRRFINNNLQSARWLIEAIGQRENTLLRVIKVVLEAQRDYFDQGPQHLKPLPMTLVADQLGIHVATVSRAVNEKYMETPRGILPLRMFFSGGTETKGGDAVSWAAIQAKLKEIIDEEDKSNPLGDDLLVEKLKAKGIDIARRTVAKYRKQLNIPTARQRKQY